MSEEEEEKRLKRNEYHRNWYKSNLEKQRAFYLTKLEKTEFLEN